MKGTNHFDYPTASATTYKGYRPEEPQKIDKRATYQKVLKQESQSERERAKQQQQRRKEAEAQEQQARLREELERKRNELIQLERRRQEALENERRAQEQAVIKIQQDKIRRIEQEQRAKQQDQNANYRFREALRRLDVEREELNVRERQAQQRRKTNQEVQRQERQQATQYAVYLRQKEEAERAKEEEEQRAAEEHFRTGFVKHGGSKKIDYSKTCFHNPHMVFRNEPKEEEMNALQRAEQEERRQKELSAQRREREAEARQKSLERGQRAVERVEAEREYRAYSEEAEREQREYNLQRIEAGKKNQYTGIKPLTLQKMELDKRARSEQEFELKFVGAREAPSSDFASKYTIFETKYAPLPQNNISHSNLTQQQQSEDSLEIYNRNYQDILQEEQPEEHREIKEAPTPIGEEKRPMAETRANDIYYPREQLNYSQSQEDD